MHNELTHASYSELCWNVYYQPHPQDTGKNGALTGRSRCTHLSDMPQACFPWLNSAHDDAVVITVTHSHLPGQALTAGGNRLAVGKGSVRQCGLPAFSLLEILIAIAIIVVLAGILYPTIRSLSKQAEVVKCAGNLRQIGVAWKAYGVDHNGFVFTMRRSNGDPIGYTWGYSNVSYVGKLLSSQYFPTGEGLLEDPHAIFCSAARDKVNKRLAPPDPPATIPLIGYNFLYIDPRYLSGNDYAELGEYGNTGAIYPGRVPMLFCFTPKLRPPGYLSAHGDFSGKSAKTGKSNILYSDGSIQELPWNQLEKNLSGYSGGTSNIKTFLLNTTK